MLQAGAKLHPTAERAGHDEGALGQTDPRTLPEPVMTILNGWKARIANNDRIQLAAPEAQRVRTPLPEGAT